MKCTAFVLSFNYYVQSIRISKFLFEGGKLRISDSAYFYLT